jgi:hypothetical protein
VEEEVVTEIRGIRLHLHLRPQQKSMMAMWRPRLMKRQRRQGKLPQHLRRPGKLRQEKNVLGMDKKTKTKLREASLGEHKPRNTLQLFLLENQSYQRPQPKIHTKPQHL